MARFCAQEHVFSFGCIRKLYLGASVQLLISNVLLFFWRCYHCEMSSHVSVLVWRDIYTNH